MSNIRWIFLFFSIICDLTASTAHAHNFDPKIVFPTLHKINIHDGKNTIFSMSRDGRNGVITHAWRENGNAWSYHVYMVTLPRKEEPISTHIVGFLPLHHKFQDVITTFPHTNDDSLSCLVFARGIWNGEKRFFLLKAVRHLNTSPAFSSPTTIDVYVLQSSSSLEQNIGNTPDFFEEIASVPAGSFHNAETAMTSATKLQP